MTDGMRVFDQDDPRGQQEQEQMHALAIEKLRAHQGAFMLAYMDDDSIVRVGCINSQSKGMELIAFANALMETAKHYLLVGYEALSQHVVEKYGMEALEQMSLQELWDLVIEEMDE